MTEQFGSHAEAYILEKMRAAKSNIDMLCGQDVSLGELIDACKEANSWIKFVCDGDEELYEDYQYHVYPLDGHFYVFTGKPPSTEPDIEEP